MVLNPSYGVPSSHEPTYCKPLWATAHEVIQGLMMFTNQNMCRLLSRNVHRLWTATPRKKKHSIWVIVSSSRTFENTNIKSVDQLLTSTNQQPIKTNTQKDILLKYPPPPPKKKTYTKPPWHCPPGHRFPLDLAIFGLKARPSTSPQPGCQAFPGWHSTFEVRESLYKQPSFICHIGPQFLLPCVAGGGGSDGNPTYNMEVFGEILEICPHGCCEKNPMDVQLMCSWLDVGDEAKKVESSANV